MFSYSMTRNLQATSGLPVDNTVQFGFLLRDVSRLLARRFVANADDLELTLPQCRVIALLARNEGSNQAKLASLSGIEPMTLVRILDRMEQDGWIKRHDDPVDRRAHTLSLQAKATPKIEHIWRVADKICSESLVALAPVEREKLIDMLEAVHKKLLALERQ